eukprot:7831988-Pyramimonas_sp.AAC.1
MGVPACIGMGNPLGRPQPLPYPHPDLGEYLHAASLPFLIGRDWNAPPALLGRLGWASTLRGRTIAPASPTCTA